MVSKTELKNAGGRDSFMQNNDLGLGYVGFEVSMEHPGGGIENTMGYRSWSLKKEWKI